MPDRTITMAGSDSDARYRIRDTDPATSGDLVIERLDGSGNVVDTIATWDDTAEEWVFSEFTALSFFGADVLNAAENQILVTQGDGTLSVETQAEGPNPYDQAQTFAESDVTVTNTNTRVFNESIELDPNSYTSGQTNSTSRDTDDDVFDPRNAIDGLEINPNYDIIEMTLTVSSNTSGATQAYVYDSIGGNQIASTSISSGTASFTFNSPLTSGTTYYVGLDDNGNDYAVGVDQDPTFPYTGTGVDITNGAFDIGSSGGGTSTPRNIITVEVTEAEEVTSGNALIEWDRGIPTDIFSWDVATFTRTLDNETVTVDVEDSSGNVLLSDIDRNTDISSIADQTNIKLRANLSRNDTANNPTLDSAYRSWFV